MATDKKKLGDRIVELRESIGVSQENFADMIGLSDRTQIYRYEKGQAVPGKKRLKKIADVANTTVAYLLGETDIKDPLLYYQATEAAADEGYSEYIAEETAKIEHLKSFFNRCGFLYENIGNEARYDFAVFDNKQPAGPHKLTDKRGLTDTLYLSDEEINGLFSNMSDALAFECFRILRMRDKENGND